MAANPKLYEEGTTTLLAPFEWNGGVAVGNGEESTPVEFDLVNVGASSDEMTEAELGVLQSTDGGVTWGLGEATADKWMQIQAYDVTDSGTSPQTTSYIPVGEGSRLSLYPIPAAGGRKLRAKVVVPIGAVSPTSIKLKIIVYWRLYRLALDAGVFESGGRGVYMGTRNAAWSGIIQGSTISASGTPDDEVHIDDTLIWVYRGQWKVIYPSAITLSASAAGNSRRVTISAGAGPTLTITASTEVVGVAPLTAQPAVPEHESLVAYVYVDDTVIGSEDIDTTGATLKGAGVVSLAGAVLTLGALEILAGRSWTRRDKHQTVTLTDDALNTVYQLPNGSAENKTGTNFPTDPHAEPLWEITLASGSETLRRDLRKTLAAGDIWTFDAYIATAAVNAAHYGITPPGQQSLIRLPKGVWAGNGDPGDRDTGSTEWELEYWDGATWTSVFSSTTYRLKVAAGEYSGSAIPDTVYLDPSTPIRWRVAALPTGGTTDPSHLIARVEFEKAA